MLGGINTHYRDVCVRMDGELSEVAVVACLFADDIVLFAESKEKHKILVNEFCSLCMRIS